MNPHKPAQNTSDFKTQEEADKFFEEVWKMLGLWK